MLELATSSVPVHAQRTIVAAMKEPALPATFELITARYFRGHTMSQSQISASSSNIAIAKGNTISDFSGAYDMDRRMGAQVKSVVEKWRNSTKGYRSRANQE
jgi:hypothetical protein